MRPGRVHPECQQQQKKPQVDQINLGRTSGVREEKRKEKKGERDREEIERDE